MSLQQFNFESHAIRTIIEESELWFAAKDVCAAIDISWRGEHSLEGIKESWRMVRDYRTIQGERETYFISEPAVYKLAFRSRKPEAERFTDWLASEVLPALRKTGTYQIGQPQGIAPTVSMTLPDGTRIEGVPLEEVLRRVNWTGASVHNHRASEQPALFPREKQQSKGNQRLFINKFELEEVCADMHGMFTTSEIRAKDPRIGKDAFLLRIKENRLPEGWTARKVNRNWIISIP
jgi:hypothetical protein